MGFDAQKIRDDAVLMQRYAAGDHSAARALIERHAHRAMALAIRLLTDPTEAEDVSQEAMIRLFKKAPDWDADRAQVSTWLYRVAYNLCMDRLRARQPNGPLDDMAELMDDKPSVVDNLQQTDQARTLYAAIDQLPVRQRTAVTLRHIEERSNIEVAEIMGISVDATESLIARGRRQLTEILTPKRDSLGALQ